MLKLLTRYIIVFMIALRFHNARDWRFHFPFPKNEPQGSFDVDSSSSILAKIGNFDLDASSSILVKIENFNLPSGCKRPLKKAVFEML